MVRQGAGVCLRVVSFWWSVEPTTTTTTFSSDNQAAAEVDSLVVGSAVGWLSSREEENHRAFVWFSFCRGFCGFSSSDESDDD